MAIKSWSVADKAVRLAAVVLCTAVPVGACAGQAGQSAVPRALPIALPEVHGRIYVDGQTYSGTSSVLGDGLTINNARLSASGVLPHDWTYLLEYDFAHKEIKYTWMRYDGLGPLRVKAGQYKEPFSLEELTSTRFITFMQRGLPNALVAGYHIGVGVKRRARRWTAALGLFNRPTSGYATKTGPNGSWAVTGRLTWSPVDRKGELLHLGADASFRLAGDANTYQVHQRPEADQAQGYYLDTGQVTGVDHFATVGVEGAAMAGAWSVQGEYVGTHVARRASDPSLNFGGAYAFVSWFPTGESRNYHGGRFGRIHPRHRAGAVQLALRYSYLDLNSGPVQGGRERDVTLGVNWYMTPYTRLMFNYVKVHAQLASDTQTPNIFLARLQSDF